MEQRRDGAVVQPDYSGLQVISENTAPEVNPVHLAPEVYHDNAQSMPQAVDDNEHRIPSPGGQTPQTPYKGDYETQGSPISEADNGAAAATAPQDRKPWWKHKRWIIAIVIIVLAVVGAIVGGVVATSPDDNTSSASIAANSSSTPRSACRDLVCPQILASAALNAWTSTPTIILFARGIDNAIWYISAAASSLSPSWPSTQKWQSLPSGGPFLGQPSALTWGNGTRASVFALTDPNHLVRTWKFVDAEKVPVMESLGGPLSSVVATCAVNGSRPDLWTSVDTNVTHNFGIGPGFEDGWNVQSNSQWPVDVFFGSKISSKPAVVCRPSPYIHDVVAYGADGAVRHMQFSDELGVGWTPPTNRGGRFLGEPVVVEVNAERLDFFGIGEDKHMYHFTWSRGGGYTALEDVGESFESVPSVAVTALGPRLDVVALGTNDRLQHRVLQGSKWVSDWEDLGVFGNSAPLLVNLTLTQPQKVGVFVIGEKGEVNQTTWTVSSDLSWKGLAWKGMGGSMTTEFYRN